MGYDYVEERYCASCAKNVTVGFDSRLGAPPTVSAILGIYFLPIVPVGLFLVGGSIGGLIALVTIVCLAGALWPSGDRPTITTVRCPTCNARKLTRPRKAGSKARCALPIARVVQHRAD
jgi:hypothetical protein